MLTHRRINLGLNMCSLRGFGSAVVGQGILRGLAEAAPGFNLEVWTPSSWPTLAVRTARIHPSGAGWLRKLAIETAGVRWARRTHGLDVLFSAGDTGSPWPAMPHLLLVQSAFLAQSPDHLDFPLSRRFRARLALQHQYFALGMPEVSRFTVQSEYMRLSLSTLWSIPTERIDVTPSVVPVVNEPAPSARSQRPLLAYISSPGPHKNHEILADVLAALQRRGESLRAALSVDRGDVPGLVQRADRLGVGDLLDFRGPLTPQRVGDLLAEAWVVVNPSKLESFGLTYYEAMSRCTPMVVADRPFAHEACGDAAVYANPDDGDAIADAVLAALNTRSLLRTRAIARLTSARLGWPEIGGRYAAICAELVAMESM